MYKSLALLKNPIENLNDIASQIEEICTKIGVTYKGLKIGEYGSKKEGFIPIYCFSVDANGYSFQINYQEGLDSFQSNATKGFTRTDYTAKFEIYGNKSDANMDYFNDFTLLCENIEKRFECILIQFNRESQLWEII